MFMTLIQMTLCLACERSTVYSTTLHILHMHKEYSTRVQLTYGYITHEKTIDRTHIWLCPYMIWHMTQNTWRQLNTQCNHTIRWNNWNYRNFCITRVIFVAHTNDWSFKVHRHSSLLIPHYFIVVRSMTKSRANRSCIGVPVQCTVCHTSYSYCTPVYCLSTKITYLVP